MSAALGQVGLRKAHPYGCEPEGNAWIATASGPPARGPGLGYLRALPDEMLLDLLSSYLDAKDLGRLACASKALYVFSHQEDVWRAHVLTKFSGRFTPSPAGWKGAYYATATGRSPETYVHRPIRVERFYSDLLFKSFLCANAEFSAEWVKHDRIERRSAKDFTVEEFIRDFESVNRPVIITDMVPAWPAATRWTPAYLSTVCGDATFDAGGFSFTMGEYFKYAACVTDDQPLYLFDKTFARKFPTLAAEYTVPEYFKQDLFSVLGPDKRPDHKWIIVGPKHSGSVFHKDPNATCAWNAVISGSKKWILFPPHMAPPGVHASADGSEVATPMSIIEWFVDFYSAARKIIRKEEAAWARKVEQLAALREKARRAGAVAGASAAVESLHISGAKRERAEMSATSTEELDADCAAAPPAAQRVRTGEADVDASSGTAAAAGGATAVAAAPRITGAVHRARGSTGLASSSSAAASTCGGDVTAYPSAASGAGDGDVVYDSRGDPIYMGPVEGVCSQGSCIFVPRGWWHAVCNLEDSIAITHNYVAGSNLSYVLRFLRDMKYAVSGVPPEEAETLFERFCDALRDKKPDVWARVAKDFDPAAAGGAISVASTAADADGATGGAAAAAPAPVRWSALISSGAAAASRAAPASTFSFAALAAGAASGSSTAATGGSGSSSGGGGGFSFGFSLAAS